MLKIIAKGIIIIFIFIFPNFFVNAELKSENYIIHENVNYEFDGPVILNVNHSVNGLAVSISWNTDINADSSVVYSTISGFTDGSEQGSTAKNTTSHSVVLTGLSANTIYYHKAKSARVNGGVSYSPQYTFTTGQAESTDQERNNQSSGGGVLIIDKTDKNPPEISNLNLGLVTKNSATIKWETNEQSTAFVEFKKDNGIKNTFGDWEMKDRHEITLLNLEPETTYIFNVLSSDDWGNIGYSEKMSFTTGKSTEAGVEDITPLSPDEENILDQINSRIRGFFIKLLPGLTLNDNQDIININSIEELSNYMPLPILSGEPRVELNGNQAKISWTTDIDATSQVAISEEGDYNSILEEPYAEIIGNTEYYSTNHSVNIYGLQPNKTYHYQLRSKSKLGPMAKSNDFTFKTGMEEFVISSHYVQIISNEEAIFKWITNKESNTLLKYTPYENNVLSVNKTQLVRDDNISAIHEVDIKNFVAGVNYEIQMISMDALGNIANKTISIFSTSKDDLPPEIRDIKAESTVFIDQANRIQTVISWKTNEPATSKIYFQEGVHSNNTKLQEESFLNQDFSKEHVMVLTKFKSGTVYSFRVESVDSGGNTTLSNVNTFMTAKKKESIFQIILGILENTFGWLKKLL